MEECISRSCLAGLRADFPRDRTTQAKTDAEGGDGGKGRRFCHHVPVSVFFLHPRVPVSPCLRVSLSPASPHLQRRTLAKKNNLLIFPLSPVNFGSLTISCYCRESGCGSSKKASRSSLVTLRTKAHHDCWRSKRSSPSREPRCIST